MLTLRSTNMYKKRIKKWGVVKNNREDEMRAVVRKYKQRLRRGMRTEVRIRGHLVEYQDVVRYWQRKGRSPDEISIRRRASMTPEAVECFTPVPSPMTSPRLLELPERILTAIRDYYYGSFESGTWLITNDGLYCHTIIEGQVEATVYLVGMRYHSCEACRLFAYSSYQEAGQTLIASTANVKEILLVEHPQTLGMLFMLIVDMKSYDRLETAFLILQQFSALSKCVHRNEHPMNNICTWLASMDPSHINELSIKRIQSIGDLFKAILGPVNRVAQSAQLSYLKAVARGNRPFQTNVPMQLQTLLGGGKASLGPSEQFEILKSVLH